MTSSHTAGQFGEKCRQRVRQLCWHRLIGAAIATGLVLHPPSSQAALARYEWEYVERAAYYLLTITHNGKTFRARTSDLSVILAAGSQVEIIVVSKHGNKVGWPMPLVTLIPEPLPAPSSAALDAPVPQKALGLDEHATQDEAVAMGEFPGQNSTPLSEEPQQVQTDEDPAPSSLWDDSYRWTLAAALGNGSETINAQGGSSRFEAKSPILSGDFEVTSNRMQSDLGFASFLGLGGKVHIHNFRVEVPAANDDAESESLAIVKLARSHAQLTLEHMLWGNFQKNLHFSYGLIYHTVPAMQVFNQINGDSSPRSQSLAAPLLGLGLKTSTYQGFDFSAEAAYIPFSAGALVVRKWLLAGTMRYYVWSNYFTSLGLLQGQEEVSGKLTCPDDVSFCESNIASSVSLKYYSIALGLVF